MLIPEAGMWVIIAFIVFLALAVVFLWFELESERARRKLLENLEVTQPIEFKKLQTAYEEY